MIPAELHGRQVRLPEKDGCRIVIFTGSALRHDRFALRLQQEFGERVVAWFQVVPDSGRPPKAKGPPQGVYAKLKRIVANPRSWPSIPRRIRAQIQAKPPTRNTLQEDVEERLFGDEVRGLRKTAHLAPTQLSDPNADEVVETVAGLRPYLILALGGAIYGQRLLNTATGIALNQHDGWCPAYRGAKTVDWTLYRRDIARVGNTVHLLTQGMDAGPIVRRSTACLVPEDTRESCFARVVALGTELMCEVVAEVISSDVLTVYDQSGDDGFTYLSSQHNAEIVAAIDRDLANGLLSFELSRMRRF